MSDEIPVFNLLSQNVVNLEPARKKTRYKRPSDEVPESEKQARRAEYLRNIEKKKAYQREYHRTHLAERKQYYNDNKEHINALRRARLKRKRDERRED